MEESMHTSEENPIPEIVDAITYRRLNEFGLLDTTGLRNYCIKRRYRQYRDMGLNMYDSLALLAKEYHLSYDYLRKMTSVERIYVRKERRVIL